MQLYNCFRKMTFYRFIIKKVFQSDKHNLIFSVYSWFVLSIYVLMLMLLSCFFENLTAKRHQSNCLCYHFITYNLSIVILTDGKLKQWSYQTVNRSVRQCMCFFFQMLVVVKTNDGTNDVCYVTRLVPDEMGTFDELKEQVIEANNSGVALTSPANEVIFFKTNIEADVSMLGETAAKMCEDTPILWLEKQQSNQGAVQSIFFLLRIFLQMN